MSEHRILALKIAMGRSNLTAGRTGGQKHGSDQPLACSAEAFSNMHAAAVARLSTGSEIGLRVLQWRVGNGR